MFCQLQDQGGVSVSSEIQTVAQEIAEVQTELKGVVKSIDQEEAKPKTSQDEKKLERLWKEKEQLREKEKQLREKEKQLREQANLLQQKELILLQQSGAISILCISSRSPRFSSLLSSSFAPSYHPSSITRFHCICSIFSSSEVGVVHLFVCGS
jgi:hypothetical protein